MQLAILFEIHCFHLEGDLSIQYEQSYKTNFRNVEVMLYDAKEAESSNNNSNNNSNKSDQALFEEFYREADPNSKGLFSRMMSKSRSYNFDTTPKLLGTREELTEILIKSGVGRYLEFKNVDDIYIYDNSSKFMEKVYLIALTKCLFIDYIYRFPVQRKTYLQTRLSL
jgi:hypothetical protein